jgi:hypothetical protein
MTADEALVRAREHWSAYLREAERLGFRVIEERVWDWTDRGYAGHSAHLHLYREPTFLDFYASVPEGNPPPWSLPGFGGVQLYTFHQKGPRNFTLTNGAPPHAPRSRLGDWIDRMVNLPEEHQVFRMKDASDLEAVVERHRRALGNREPLVPQEPVIEQRWRWMEEMEAEAEDGEHHP